MKSINLILVMLLMAGVGYGQVDCRPYLPTDKGTKWELSDYTAKGKFDGKTTFELVDKVVSGDDITFKVAMTSYDKKEKDAIDGAYEAKCVDGKFEMSMSAMLSGTSMEAFESMDFEVDASTFELPDMDAKPGTTFEDGSMTVSLTGGGPVNMGMTINVTNRKVEAHETIETPAGKFDCIVFSQTVNTKMIMNIEGSSKEWYAEGVGVVRSESYNKNGKLTGYSELTKFEK